VHKDPSLNKVKYSLKHLEVMLLMAGMQALKSQEISEENIESMENLIDEALLKSQNIMLRAIKIIKTPELLSLVPTQKTNN